MIVFSNSSVLAHCRAAALSQLQSGNIVNGGPASRRSHDVPG
jgi:hypothetical protein